MIDINELEYMRDLPYYYVLRVNDTILMCCYQVKPVRLENPTIFVDFEQASCYFKEFKASFKKVGFQIDDKPVNDFDDWWHLDLITNYFTNDGDYLSYDATCVDEFFSTNQRLREKERRSNM